MKEVACVGHRHSCPIHGEGTIISGATGFTVSGRPVARVSDKISCCATIVTGAAGFIVDSYAVACKGDTTDHGGVLLEGEWSFVIGSAPAASSYSDHRAMTQMGLEAWEQRNTGNDLLRQAFNDENLSLLRRIQGYGKRAWKHVGNAGPVLTVLALVFALIAIWWFGPRWSWKQYTPLASVAARMAISIALVMIPVLVWTFILRTRYHALQEEKRQQQARQHDPIRVFEDDQQRVLDANLDMLRRNLGRRRGLYRLPWYVVIGQEDAGKTSFINRSNQSFALTGVAKASRWAGHERTGLLDIDWWIGNDAVLIDPPGELISPHAPPATQMASAETTIPTETPIKQRAHAAISEHPELPARLWKHFVGWLAHNRSRRPLNGAILVIDVPILMNGKASDRKALAGLIRARLRDLMEQLDTRLPIYVVISKFDLVRGFDTFFAQLPKADRQASLGFTCTLDSLQDFDAWIAELNARYDAFVMTLHEQIFDAMARQKKQEAREDLFAFGRQMSGVKTALFTFLADVFESDRYSTPALVRGMYFTSVYQQGIPTNTFVNAIASTYHMPPVASRALPMGQATTYFAEDLFQRIVYPEAGLAGDNLRVLRSKRRLMLASSLVAALGCAVVIGGWQYYYTVNRDNAYQVLEKSRAFVGKPMEAGIDPTGRNLLQPLNQLRESVAVFENYRQTWPLVEDMGLYQGRTLGPKVDRVYMDLLGKRFLPDLATGVMDTLNQTTQTSDERLTALRVYRMIEDLHNREPTVVQRWMARYWQSAFPGDGATQEQLMRHLEYAMKYVDADLPQYRPLVDEIQNDLRQVPLPQRVYTTLKQQAGTALPPPLDLRQEIGPAYSVVYRTPVLQADANGVARNPLLVDRLLTSKGFKEYFVSGRKNLIPLAAMDQWTLGMRKELAYSEEDQRDLTDAVRALYTADYVTSWRQALNQLVVTDFRDLDHGVQVLDSVTGSADPLRRLLTSVQQNTRIYTPVTGSATAVEKAEAKLMEDPDREQAARISREFAELARLPDAGENKSSALDETRKALVAVHDYLKAVQDSPNRGQAALNAAMSRLRLEGSDPIFTLQRQAANLPEPFNLQVGKLADESARVLVLEAMRELEQRWERDVHGFYRERLAGRYPLDPSSRQDVALQDFEAFFGPQGKLQQFQDQYLKLFLEDASLAHTGNAWLNPQLQPQLQAAQRVREAFFDGRGALGLQFNVQPLALSSSDRSSVLNVDGQLVSYGHGPSVPTGLIWPNALRDGMESKVTLVDSAGRSQALRFGGAWAWFRLLSQSQLNGTTGSSVDVSFTLGNGAARYRISADNAGSNPFTQRLFKGFDLPRGLRPTVAMSEPAVISAPASGNASALNPIPSQPRARRAVR